jgi:hypothetical protein
MRAQQNIHSSKVRLTQAGRSIFFIVLLSLIGLVNYGQTTASASHTITLNITNAIELTFAQGTNGVSLTFSNSEHYQNGIVADNSATLRVRSNKGYNISVKSASSVFNSSTNTQMPVSNVLFVKEANQSGFVGINTNDQTLLTSQQKGNQFFNVSYKANPGFGYDGGTYSVNIVYTASQQ